MNTFLGITKGILGLGVSFGTGAIVSNIAKATMPSTAGKFTKICVAGATMVISGMAGKFVVDSFEEDFDNTVEAVEEMIGLLKDQNKDLKTEEESV
jgi:hypothetical protein